MKVCLISYGTRDNFGRCFEDSVDYFYHALTDLRYNVYLEYKDKADLYFVFGWHLSDAWRQLPKERTVIIQLENLISGSLQPMFRAEMFEGWNIADYSAQNHIAYKFHARSFTSFQYGYHPNMQYINFDRRFEGKTCDVLFVGSMTPRRLECIQSMRHHVKVDVHFNVFGNALYRLMRSSRIIVSPDAYEEVGDKGHIPASLRIAFALNQGMPVLMENSSFQRETTYWKQFAQVTTPGRFGIKAFEMLELDYHNHCDAAERWCNNTSMRASVSNILTDLKLSVWGNVNGKATKRLGGSPRPRTKSARL